MQECCMPVVTNNDYAESTAFFDYLFNLDIH